MSVRRGSLRDRLDRVLDMEDGEVFQLLEELDEEVDRSIGFRWHAPATQARQDHHLAMYLQFVRFIFRKARNTPEDALKLEGFPEDLDKLGRLFRKFLVFVYKNAVPRSRAIGESISYRTLTQYRDSMMFWVARTFNERNSPVPNRSKLFNEMTEAIRYVQGQYGTGSASKPLKSTIGLAELRQLIDHEMYHNICIENSEQHQVAWCIARMVAVRPGSLGPSRKGRNAPLKWKDVSFTTGDAPGKFDVTLNFPNIDIKAAGATGPGMTNDPRPLRVTIASPTDSDGLVLSVAHRLLVIALRRGILDGGISSIGDLMNTNLHQLHVKKEHENDPLFFRSVPKGTALDPPHPLTAPQMTDYLASRGLALGYNQCITFYSLRRKAATDLTRRVGVENARTIMGHAPETRTLERYYLDLVPLLDISGIQTEQPIEPGGVSSELVQADPSSLAVNRLGREARAKTRGFALTAYTNMLIHLDPDQPPADPEQLKQYRKLMARRAKKQLIAKESELQKRSMTRDEFQGRIGAVNASRFAQSLLESAQAALSGPPPTETDVGEVQEDEDHDLDSLFEEDDGYEEDIEETAGRGDVEDSLFVQPDEEEASDQQVSGQAPESTVQFKDLATSFMNHLMDNALTTYTGPFKSSNATCPLCENDDTVSAGDKAKVWHSHAHLERHMGSIFHSPKSRWERRMKRLHALNGPVDAPWSCPYCENSKEYARLSDVERHIRDSTLKLNNPESVRHERLKNEDGWFEADWEGHTSKARERSRERATKRNLKDMGIEFTDYPPELSESIPAPGQPNSVLGGPPFKIPRHALEASVFVDEPRGATTVPPHLEASTELVDIDNIRQFEIPPEFAHLTEFTDIPGSKP